MQYNIKAPFSFDYWMNGFTEIYWNVTNLHCMEIYTLRKINRLHIWICYFMCGCLILDGSGEESCLWIGKDTIQSETGFCQCVEEE